MRIFHFSTVVSSSYLYKFLAMQESLDQHCRDYHLFALCVDLQVYNILKRLPLKNITILKLSDVENSQLLTAQSNRNYHEFCWTLKPYMLNYIMEKYRDTQYFAHLDADLYFYSDPVQIIYEAPDAATFLTDHNNSERFLHTYKTSGIYNTGFVCCKQEPAAYEAVGWWLDRCMECCCLVANVEKNLYGDQKYVEQWPKQFSKVHIVRNKGANAAQWNIEGFQVSEREGKVYLNGDRLIFYHFSGVSIMNHKEYNLATFYRIADEAEKLIYAPYIKTLSRYIENLNMLFPAFKEGMLDKKYIRMMHYYRLL